MDRLRANMGGSASDDQFWEPPRPAAEPEPEPDRAAAPAAREVEPEPPVRPAGRMEHWSVGFWPPVCRDPYKAPEQRDRVLQGAVYGSPTYADGDKVQTSRIVRTSGTLVVTASGSVYELGTPDPDYVAWVESNHGPWDAANPVRIVTSDDTGGPGV